MRLMVITSPHEVEDEAQKIAQLFDAGLEILHFRKPDWDLERYEALLRAISPLHYKKIVIHSHFKLIEKYNLKGVHFRSKYLSGIEERNVKEVFRLAIKKNITISASMHSFQEIRNNTWKFDYVFLSPLFDSISKEGYVSAITPAEVMAFVRDFKSSVKLVALGGISEKNVMKVMEYGFSGAALLGYIWNEGVVVEQFNKIKTKLGV